MQRKTAIRITVVLVSLGGLGFGLLQMLPNWVDTQALKREIEDGLHQSTGVNFSIREIKLEPTFFHGLQVHLNTSTITDLQHHPLGDIGNITVQIRYWPILTQQLPEIAKVHLNHVLIPVGKQNLFKSMRLKLVKPKRTGFLKPAEMQDTEILLTDYRIEDTVPSPAVHRLLPLAKAFTLRGPELSVKHLQSQQPISLRAHAELAFTPASAWSGNRSVPAPIPAHMPPRAFWQSVKPPQPPSQAVQANLMLELPQLAPQQSELQLRDLRKLELSLAGAQTDLNLHYQQDAPGKSGTPQTASGSLQSAGLALGHGQVLALQLGNTLGLSLPAQLNQVVLAGQVKLDHQFQLAFPVSSASNQLRLQQLNGQLEMMDVAIAPVDPGAKSGANQGARPWLSQGRGVIQAHDQQLQTNGLTLALDGLPVTVQGWARLDNQRLNARIMANHLQVTSLKDSLSRFGATSSSLQGVNFQGLVDFNAVIAGTFTQPVYQGMLSVHNAKFQDAAQGVVAGPLNGQVRFDGAGLQKPVVRYQGQLHVNDGRLVDAKQGLNVQHFDGNVTFAGRYQGGAAVALPIYNGQINIRQAQYQDPKTGILMSGIQGLIRLGGEWIHLEKFRGVLAGSIYTAQGQIQSDLKNYSLNLRSERIDLPQLKREVAPHFPQAKAALAQLDPYQGKAKLNVTLTTGMNLKGRVDVNALAVRTGQPDYPLKVPTLSVLIDHQQFTVPETIVSLGAVPITLSAQGRQSGQYRVNVASGEVPVSVVRDNQRLLASLSPMALPELWNTAGSFRFAGQVTNGGKDFNLDFQNAGFSWAGGDFPFYDLNGSLNYQQTGNGLPAVASRNLNFRYGNSPVSVSLDNHGQLNAVAEGVMSALSVNHFLVSRQSEATPYRDIPFQATTHGVLAALPGRGSFKRKGIPQNDVITDFHLNLEPNFRHAYDGTVEAPVATPAPFATAGGDTSPSESSALSGAASEGALALTHPVRTVTHVLNTARQAVQAGLDTLIGSGSASAQGLSALGQSTDAASKTIVGKGFPLSGDQGASSLSSGAGSAKEPEFLPGDPGAAYLSSRWHWQGENLQLEQARLHLFDAGDLLANGTFEKFLSPARSVFLLRLASQPGIDLAKLSQGATDNLFFKDAKGQVGMDLQVAGNAEGPKLAAGWMDLKKVAFPYLTLRDLTGRLTVDGETAQAVVDNFEIPGVAVSATGHTLNLFEMPVSLEDVKIHGPMLSIESLGAFSNLIVRPILVDQLAHNFMRPWQQGDPTIPLQFRNGDLTVDEVIYQNIILNNLTSKFSVYANSYFELSNTSIEAAGGTAHGYLSMSPNDSSFTTLELNVDKVKANALTKALLNVTNQIFGDVNGTVRFTTFGDTDAAMQQNANGTVSVRVINGRLPAIARVETLLTTANILRGGLLGLNLNNLLRSLTFYDTNYFATLSGDMLINNQVLYTRNLSSLGVNLDLLIRGSLRMDNGNANMMVDGRMRQVVAGKLGALGKLSLGGLVGYIPALGTFGKNRTGLLGYIPGVGWVPGFGGPAGDINRFQVRLMGDLNTPGAIQDFRWVK